MRVLVCGGRDYDDEARLRGTLDRINADGHVTLVIEGGATGADMLAKLWAQDNGIRVDTYAAEWGKHGRAAGPVRNATMLREGRPDLVVAFAGGRGTADCVRQAKAAGIRVFEIPEI